MSSSEKVLSDVNIDVSAQNEEINKVSKDISSIEITDKDKKIAISKKEEDECISLQDDLSNFISEKIDMSPDDGVIEVLPTGIDILDAVLGGGFGVGTFTVIVGNPGTFKSALLGQIIGSAQKKFKGNVLSSYLDSENAMTTDRLATLGVVKPKIKPYTDITVEKVFKTVEAIAAFKELRKITDMPSIVAWDSIANTTTEKERTTDDVNQTLGLKARMLSYLFPKYIPKLRDNKISLIAINQLREKMDIGQFASANDLRYMGDKVMPGGQALKFNAFHLMLLKVRGDLKYEQYGFNGIMLDALCSKNKLFSPNVPVRMLVDFNCGISNFWTNYNFLVDTKRLKSGAWNSLIALPDKKFRTKDAKDLYDNDGNFKKMFDEEVQNTIKVEILDKYK